MSKDHTLTSKQEYEPKTEEDEKEQNSGSMNSEVYDIDDEGYQTPTSEEYKIPAVVLSCPPPAPKKRKRLVLMKPSDLQRRLDQAGCDQNTIVIKEEDLDLFLETLTGESRVLPRSRRETGSKRRCVVDE